MYDSLRVELGYFRVDICLAESWYTLGWSKVVLELTSGRFRVDVINV